MSSPVSNPERAGSPLGGRAAVISGASRGIGRAVALSLAGQGASVCCVARDAAALESVAAAVRAAGGHAITVAVDLTTSGAAGTVIREVQAAFGRLDILVHSAGSIHHGTLESGRIEDLDSQYQANLRAPYALTQAALPLLLAARGDVVFINSSAGLAARRADVGQYAATKHALKAIADSLREEVNGRGVRVLTVHPGRTATSLQETLHQEAGARYRPELLLQPEDIGAVVALAVALPRTAEITDVSIRPAINSPA